MTLQINNQNSLQTSLLGKWYQVNNNGFFDYPATSEGTLLFVFNTKLYAFSEHGLFEMDCSIHRKWEEVFTPIFPSKSWTFRAFCNKYLYLYDGYGKMWFMKAGLPFTIMNWKKVVSLGLQNDVSPVPMTIFKGQIYGVSYDNKSMSFNIWRSKDIGKSVMQWKLVVDNSFNDPDNNQGLAFMTIFNNHIYAGTNTLKGIFGDPNASISGGVEIWESSTGDLGTWAQVNIDGFGTDYEYAPGKKLRLNQIIGAWATFKEHIYIGTKSHWGAEIWRYDGTGKTTGWENVTPSWAGPPPGPFANPGRNESMIVFNDTLYLAEGYPTSNIAKYDGINWSILVNGPNPFDPENGGIKSLAVLRNKLYAATLKEPYSGVTRGDQVWGYPFCACDYNKDNL